MSAGLTRLPALPSTHLTRAKPEKQLFHSGFLNSIKKGERDLAGPGRLLQENQTIVFLASRCLVCSADRFSRRHDGTMQERGIMFNQVVL